jgi:hypothetical protein
MKEEKVDNFNEIKSEKSFGIICNSKIERLLEISVESLFFLSIIEMTYVFQKFKKKYV